jgi:hypothetical protein
VRRLAFAAATAVGALWAGAWLAWWYEDPFLRRWPSPRERKLAERLVALHDEYGRQGTQPWA